MGDIHLEIALGILPNSREQIQCAFRIGCPGIFNQVDDMKLLQNVPVLCNLRHGGKYGP